MDSEIVRLDLADFAGHTLHLRWRIGALDSSTDEGWWLDDVEFLGLAGCPLEKIFSNGFESDDLSTWSSSVR